MVQIDEIFTATIEGLAFGGQGILKHHGLVVFVPFTAPGDEILCRILTVKKQFATGEIVQILKKSPLRIPPACPYFGTCGGCQLQHLSYQTQLEHKRQTIVDALQRIGKLSVHVNLIEPATEDWAYRRHVSLTLKPKGSFFQAGYIAIDNKKLVPVSECPIFIPKEDPVLQHLQELVSRLPSQKDNEGKAQLLRGSSQYILILHFKYPPPNCDRIITETMHECSIWRGIIVQSREKFLSWGKPEAELQIDDLMFRFSPRAFIQNNAEQSLKIYHELCQLAQNVRPAHILDLYCGIGISSLLLAKKGYRVSGVEFNPEAVKLAKANAKANRIDNVHFYQGDVKELLPGLLTKQKPDFLIVNPPREGIAQEVIKILLTMDINNLVYISCMPSTLSRDLQQFCAEGYKIASVQPYDMFPQTAHVETVVHLLPK